MGSRPRPRVMPESASHILTITFRPVPNNPKGRACAETFRIRTDLPGEPPLEVTATVRAE